jgi:hypothetical protein
MRKSRHINPNILKKEVVFGELLPLQTDKPETTPFECSTWLRIDAISGDRCQDLKREQNSFSRAVIHIHTLGDKEKAETIKEVPVPSRSWDRSEQRHKGGVVSPFGG